MVTIRSLLKDYTNENQYEILARVDRMFPVNCGRYFGGLLSESQVEALKLGIKSK